MTNIDNSIALGYGAIVDGNNKIQLGNTSVTSVSTKGKLTTGTVTYPNTDGNAGQVLGTNGSGILSWQSPGASYTAGNGIIFSGTQINVGNSTQGSESLALGIEAGKTLQGSNSVALGTQAGMTNQASAAIAIGSAAGRNNQSQGAIAIGYVAVDGGQGNHSVAIGSNAGQYGQGAQSVAVGYAAGQSMANATDAVAIGAFSSANVKDGTALGANANASFENSTAIGRGANTSAINTIQLGDENVVNVKTSGNLTAGTVTYPNSHGNAGQVLGTDGTGNLTWKNLSTPLTAGSGINIVNNLINVGNATQGLNSIALGFNSGLTGQLQNSIAIGSEAGNSNQGANSIAIGTVAGKSNQSANSIVLNATGLDLNAGNSGLFVKPIRQVSGSSTLMQYNTISGEVTYSETSVRENLATLSVGPPPASAVASAKLEVNSTTQGFLPPRLSYNQKMAIVSPVAGLVLWCNNCGPKGELQVYNGTEWTNMIGGIASTVPIYVGDSYGGGTVVYIFQPGDSRYVAGETHGIIAATSDVSYSSWGCTTTATGATGTAIGTGASNTASIIANACVDANNPAKLCADYRGGGYSDWFMPSRDELNLFFTSRVAIGNLATYIYWSSSETASNGAWRQNFTTGSMQTFGKTSGSHIRPARYF